MHVLPMATDPVELVDSSCYLCMVKRIASALEPSDQKLSSSFRLAQEYAMLCRGAAGDAWVLFVRESERQSGAYSHCLQTAHDAFDLSNALSAMDHCLQLPSSISSLACSLELHDEELINNRWWRLESSSLWHYCPSLCTIDPAAQEAAWVLALSHEEADARIADIYWEALLGLIYSPDLNMTVARIMHALHSTHFATEHYNDALRISKLLNDTWSSFCSAFDAIRCLISVGHSDHVASLPTRTFSKASRSF